MQTQLIKNSSFADRRVRRSELVQESLHFLASAICERVGLDNVVIVGDAGLALGAAHEGQESIALAAYAQIIAETQSTQERAMLFLKLGEWVPGAGANRISVRRVSFFNESFFLVALGDHIGRRDRGLTEAIPAVGRIFGEAWAS